MKKPAAAGKTGVKNQFSLAEYKSLSKEEQYAIQKVVNFLLEHEISTAEAPVNDETLSRLCDVFGPNLSPQADLSIFAIGSRASTSALSRLLRQSLRALEFLTSGSLSSSLSSTLMMTEHILWLSITGRINGLSATSRPT